MKIRKPRQGEVWKNADDYVVVLLVGERLKTKTEKEMVVYQHLTQDEKMELDSQGGQLVSAKLRKPYVASLSEFIYELGFVRK